MSDDGEDFLNGRYVVFALIGLFVGYCFVWQYDQIIGFPTEGLMALEVGRSKGHPLGEQIIFTLATALTFAFLSIVNWKLAKRKSNDDLE